jgi:hypothetical protein
VALGEHEVVKDDTAAAPNDRIRRTRDTFEESPAEELYASLLRQIRGAAMTADIASSTEHKLKIAYMLAIRLGAKIGLISDGLDDELRQAADYLWS